MSVLADFDTSTFTHEGKTKTVYRQGSGPAVVIMTEIPGITPKVADFARKVAALGCTVALPDLFGTAGKERTTGYIITSLAKSCVSKEFHAIAFHEASPVTVWLRALAASLHEECGGPGVGAIGMCFTGGFALAMMVDDTIVAPVLSQPATPFPFGAKRKRSLAISDDDLRVVKQRVADGCAVMGLRFTADASVPAERFARLKEELGDGFIAVEIDSSAGNPHGLKRSAHSVLTEELRDDPSHVTQKSLERVLSFLQDSLKV